MIGTGEASIHFSTIPSVATWTPYLDSNALPHTLIITIDLDGDGIPDEEDMCPYDSENDIDGDDICGDIDNCPQTTNPGQENSDNDSLGDAFDNCTAVANEDQADSDRDGVGDVCDNCPDVSNEDQADFDVDGVGDACDPLRAADIPTLSEWGLIIFMIIIMGLGVGTLFRRRIE